MQEMLAGFGVWEKELWLESRFKGCPVSERDGAAGRSGPLPGHFLGRQPWGQQDTAKEQHAACIGGSAKQPCREEAVLRLGSGQRLGMKRLQDWPDIGSASALGNFSRPGPSELMGCGRYLPAPGKKRSQRNEMI